MTTIAIIMSIGLIVMMAVAVLLIITYMRKLSELEACKEEIERQEQELRKHRNALDLWEKQISADSSKISLSVHLDTSRTVDDPDDVTPEMPDRKIYKQLASQFGYLALKQFKPNIVRTHEGGKTTYKLDLNVYPYN